MEKLFDKWIAVDWGTSTFRAYLVQNNKVITLNREIEKDMFKFCRTLTKSKFNNTPIFSCVSY